MEILEGNKLITEFMGYTIHPNEATILPASFLHIKEKDLPTYIYSWEDLMPVVEKINAFDNMVDVETFENEQYQKLEILRLRISAPIHIVHEKVIEFITWYNANK